MSRDSLAWSWRMAMSLVSSSTKSKCHLSMWLMTPSRLTNVELMTRPMVISLARAGLDVLVEVEHVVRVVGVLEGNELGELGGHVGAPDALGALVGQRVDVDAAGERGHGGRTAPGGRDPGLVVGLVGPAGAGAELEK